MQRDMDLVREVLIAVEDGPNHPQATPSISISGYDSHAIDQHIVILRDAGLLDWEACDEVCGMNRLQFRGLRLTWSGHDFLDNARNETVWKRAHSKIAESGIKTVSFAIWANVLSKIIETNLGVAD